MSSRFEGTADYVATDDLKVAVNAAVVVLRLRQPDTPRPFRVPGAIHSVPVIPIVATVAVLVMIPQLSLSALGLGVGLVALGAGVRRWACVS